MPAGSRILGLREGLFKSDDLMETLVQMRKNEVTAITCSGYAVSVFKE